MALDQTALSDLVVNVSLDDTKLRHSVTSMNRLIRASTQEWKAEFTSLEANSRHYDALKVKVDGLTKTYQLSEERVKQMRQEYQKLSADENKNAGAMDNLRVKINTAVRQMADQNSQLKRASEQLKLEEQGVNRLSREYRIMDDTLKMNVHSQELAGNKLTASRTQMMGLRNEVSKLNEVYQIEKQRLNQVQTEYGANSRAFESQAKKVVQLKSTMNDYNHIISETSRKIGGMTATDTMKFDRLSNSANKFSTAGRNIRSASQGMYSATMALGAGFFYSANQATKLENSYRMTNNLLVTGGEKQATVTKNVAQMQREGQIYSERYGKSMTSISAGYQELVKRGYSSEQSLGSMKSMLQASVASGDDFNDVVKISTSTLEAFGMRARTTQGMIRNSKKVTNELAYAADMTATSFKDIGVAMQYAGPQAHQAGVSLSETASMLGILSNNGLEAQVAGTGVRKVFSSLISPTKDGTKVLKEYGINIKDSSGKMRDMSSIFGDMNEKFKGLSKTQKANIFHKLFGMTGQNAAMILSQNADEIDKLNKKVKEAPKNNYIESLSGKNMKSAQNQLNILKQSATALGVEFAKEVLPSITSLTQAIVPLIRSLSHVNKGTKDMVVAGVAITALVAPIGTVVGSISTLIGAMQTTRAWYQRINGYTKQKIKDSEEIAAANYEEARSQEAINAAQKESIGTPGVSKVGNEVVEGENAIATGSRVEKNVSMAGKARAAWGSVGILDKANIAMTGVDIGSSIWGAVSAQSKSQRNQAIWETGGKTLGAAAGGLLGGPMGAMIGSQIGGEISKHIKIKDVEKATKKEQNKITQIQDHTAGPSYNTGKGGAWSAAYYSNANGGQFASEKDIAKYNKSKKPANPLAGMSKAVQKEARTSEKEIRNLYNTFGSLDEKSYKTLKKVSDKKVAAANSESKARIKAMQKAGLIDKQTAANMLKADESYNKKHAGKVGEDLKKLQKLNNDYYKKGIISQQSYETKKRKIINDIAKRTVSDLTKNTKEQQKIEKFFSSSQKKTMVNDAKQALMAADKQYSGIVTKARQSKNKTVAAAEEQYRQVKKEADHQYKDTHQISKAQHDAIVNAARDQKNQSKQAAEEQYKQVKKQAEKQHKAVVTEITDEVAEVKGVNTGLANWYKNHNPFKGIADDAAHALQKISGVTDGFATMEDARSKAESKARQKTQQKVGYTKNTNLKDTLNPLGKMASDNSRKKRQNAFGSNATGGSIKSTHMALVGEEGPEFAYNKRTGKARLLGASGPEFTKVYAGENILTAKQTRNALGGKKSVRNLASYANGTGTNIDDIRFNKKKNANFGSSSFSIELSKKSEHDFKTSLSKSTNAAKKFQKDNDKSFTKNTKVINKHMSDAKNDINNSYTKINKTADKQLDKLRTNNNSHLKGISSDSKKQYNKIEDANVKHLKDIDKDTAKYNKNLESDNSSHLKRLYSTTKDINQKIYKNSVDQQKNLKDSITKNDKSIYSTWKKDWNNTSDAFNTEFKKLRPYSKKGMNGAITSLNSGVGNINKLVSKFGGNNAILPSISHFANGSGRLANDEIAMVNDALGNNWKEIIQFPSGGMIEATEKNAILPIPKNSRVFNGTQTEKLKNSGLISHYAKGTVSDDELEKMVNAKAKNSAKAWHEDFDNHLGKKSQIGLQNSLTKTGKGSADMGGVPWYKALWTVISDAMSGSGAGGNWRHDPGLVKTDGFGTSRASMYGRGASHDGVDYGGALGSSILAVHGGNVIRIGGVGIPDLGDVIIVKSDDGFQEIYQEFGHKNNIKVKVGDTVKTGQRIATLGELNGAGSGSHVHIGVTRGNPLSKNMLSTAGWYDVSKMHGSSNGTKSTKKSANEKRLEKLVKSQLGNKAIKWISSTFAPKDEGSYSGVSAAPSGSHKNWLKQAGIPESQFNEYNYIISRESGWNPHATNPTSGAYGIPQSLPASKMASKGSDWKNNPITQLKWMKSYVNSAYGGIGSAVNFWKGHHAYENGGISQEHQLAEISEHNLPEAIIPVSTQKRPQGNEMLGEVVTEFAKSYISGGSDGINSKVEGKLDTLITILENALPLIIAKAGITASAIYENNKNEVLKNKKLSNYGKGVY